MPHAAFLWYTIYQMKLCCCVTVSLPFVFQRLKPHTWFRYQVSPPYRHTDVPTYHLRFCISRTEKVDSYFIYYICYNIYNINIYNFLPHHSPCDFANGTPVRRYVGTPCICPVSCKPLFYSFQPIAEEFLVGRWDNNFKMWTLSISLLTPFLNFSRNNFLNSTILQKFMLSLYSKYHLTARDE